LNHPKSRKRVKLERSLFDLGSESGPKTKGESREGGIPPFASQTNEKISRWGWGDTGGGRGFPSVDQGPWSKKKRKSSKEKKGKEAFRKLQEGGPRGSKKTK